MTRENVFDLEGYVHAMLDENQNQAILLAARDDAQLADELEILQNERDELQYFLKDNLQAIQPPQTMQFGQVAQHLSGPSGTKRKRHGAQPTLRIAAALIGIALIVLGMHRLSILPRILQQSSQPMDSGSPLILPLLSTLFLLMPPMLSANDSHAERPVNLLDIVVTLLLWFGQGLLWLVIVFTTQETLGGLVFMASGNLDKAILMRTGSIFFLGLIWLTLMILSGEHHYRFLGRLESWKSFGWTLLVSGIILAVFMLWLQL